ncbi:MAG: Rrf2 family transcriptional regulator [Lachnospiraceae bacterium]|nr:Rrf2 family transcriptional regulator [Lachnospiraceae bacterium]MDD7025553.1 Rrf2 family transcriptional regulator [Lachnospiraceae bacterium]MDY5700770.1 Rrf2 family transcriptional regulator [Lachnospiraceae bacterium]
MKFSTKGRYALRMLVDLAQHEDEGFIALKDIAKRQNISKRYLEQIVPLLNNGDILCTNRGYMGGYKLAKSAKDYTVGDILRLTESGLAPVSCLEPGANPCERADECATLPMWQGLHQIITEYLDGITLKDLADQQRENLADNYVI